jgi:hypothetical protein
MTMIPKEILILDSDGRSNPLYSSWAQTLEDCVIVDDYDAKWQPPPSCALLLSAQHYREPEYGILARAARNHIPTLILADGILEYRNTWENPEIAAGAMFQPAVGHKVACIGRSQARMLESWGNLGKCEIVGIPRFDAFVGQGHRARRSDEPFRLLVMSAKKLGFTPEQVNLSKRSIKDLKFWLSHHREIGGAELEVVWRLTNGLEQELGVENHLTDMRGSELASLLGTVDAVVTTPSTGMLEAMIRRLPVAVLDYHNTPPFIPSAWQITAPRHFDDVLPQLLHPPAPKMLYQDTILHDALECMSPATPRMHRLIHEMIQISRDCKQRNERLSFPVRILKDPQHHLPETCFDLEKLYPGHPVFGKWDQVELQVEIHHLRLEIQRLQDQLRAHSVLREVLQYVPGPKKLKRYWLRLQARYSA